MAIGAIQRKWARWWMRFAGLTPSGRMAAYLASWFAPPYKGRTYLAHLTKNSYVSPDAKILHNKLQIDHNVFIGERVVIYQAPNGGNVKIGKRTRLHRGIIIETGEGGSLTIGNDTHIQPRCQFSAYKGDIKIGSDVQIAPFCAFYPYNHRFDPGIKIRGQRLYTKGGIEIADDAWIGVGASILDGVRIGRGAVVGAGSVVNHDIPDEGIAAGNPARVIRMRKDLAQ